MTAVTTLPCSSSMTAGSASGRAPAATACSKAAAVSGTASARSTTPSPCCRTCSPIGVPACTSPVTRNRAPPDSRTYSARSRERSEEHTSELQSRVDLVCRLLLEKKKKKICNLNNKKKKKKKKKKNK